jgi:hypothetical protein
VVQMLASPLIHSPATLLTHPPGTMAAPRLLIQLKTIRYFLQAVNGTARYSQLSLPRTLSRGTCPHRPILRRAFRPAVSAHLQLGHSNVQPSLSLANSCLPVYHCPAHHILAPVLRCRAEPHLHSNKDSGDHTATAVSRVKPSSP